MAGNWDFGELFAHPETDPIPVGLRAGDLVHGLRIAGTEPETGALGDGLAAQMELAYGNLRRSVEGAGGGLGNVAHVSFFLADTRAAMPEVNRLWVETFADENDRPTYKFMSAELGGGQWVSVEYFAVLGAHRQVLHIPGVAHGNPIPMGVRAGRYLFSSRVLPMDPATGKPGPDAETQTELVFANVDALLEVGGMAWGDVAQGRAFLADLDSLSLVRERWAARGAGGALHPLQYQVAPSLLVMLEIFAARR